MYFDVAAGQFQLGVKAIRPHHGRIFIADVHFYKHATPLESNKFSGKFNNIRLRDPAKF